MKQCFLRTWFGFYWNYFVGVEKKPILTEHSLWMTCLFHNLTKMEWNPRTSMFPFPVVKKKQREKMYLTAASAVSFGAFVPLKYHKLESQLKTVGVFDEHCVPCSTQDLFSFMTSFNTAFLSCFRFVPKRNTVCVPKGFSSSFHVFWGLKPLGVSLFWPLISGGSTVPSLNL